VAWAEWAEWAEWEIFNTLPSPLALEHSFRFSNPILDRVRKLPSFLSIQQLYYFSKRIAKKVHESYASLRISLPTLLKKI